MGFLTTVTFRNDHIDSLLESPEELVEYIRTACYSMKGDTNLRPYTNSIIPQFSRHADDHTCYVHMGNTVCDMNSHDQETRDLIRSHPEFAKKMTDFMEGEVKELKRLLKFAKEERKANGKK